MIALPDISWRLEPLLIRFPEQEPPICVPIIEDASGPFDHTFGGPTLEKGAICEGCPEPMHLIFSFNPADRNFPIQIDGTRSFRLFYPIQYNCSSIWYRTRGDSDIEIVQQPEKEWSSEFPYPGYPKWYPKRRVRLDRPRRLRLRDDELRSFQKAYGDQSQDPLNLVEWACGLSQGAPRSTCINPECRRQPMVLFAIIPVDDLFGFDLAWPDSNGKLTYEICPRCSMIHGTNQA